MKKQILLFSIICAATLTSFAQFTFVAVSDLHISDTIAENSDVNAQYFRCAMKEFEALQPKPAFVVVSGDISNVGNIGPDGMYTTLTQYLFPPVQTNPGIGTYFIDSALTIPVYFTPGNHEYWTGFLGNGEPISNDTLTYYVKNISPNTDYVIATSLAVVVVLRSGSDGPYGIPPNPQNIEGTGLSDTQINWLRNVLISNSSKRKIIVFHHPAVNVAGTNSDGTPYTGEILDTADNSILNNRTRFLNICDSNHVDLVLNGHEHQNVVAKRNGQVVDENWPDSTRYVQTAAAFNRSYRIISVDPLFVTVGLPMRSCGAIFGVKETTHSSLLSVFPNPATDNITIECNQKATLEILNIQGQILKTINSESLKTIFDMTDLSAGVYIVKAKTEYDIVIGKFVKQ
ncbi:MAG: metallophosphoesterase [Bacteroidetes bacterium]|nr:metallophosphoesterase [Bacteroidota bacterium]